MQFGFCLGKMFPEESSNVDWRQIEDWCETLVPILKYKEWLYGWIDTIYGQMEWIQPCFTIL